VQLAVERLAPCDLWVVAWVVGRWLGDLDHRGTCTGWCGVDGAAFGTGWGGDIVDGDVDRGGRGPWFGEETVDVVGEAEDGIVKPIIVRSWRKRSEQQWRWDEDLVAYERANTPGQTLIALID
jgi:hypothetical protein